jgi:colicin import membrane protein
VISNTVVRKAVQVEYSLLRVPLAVVNRGVASRFGADSKVRLTVERGLGALDAKAAQLLTDSPPSRRDEGVGRARPTSPAAADVPADGNVEPTHDEVQLSHDDEVQRVAEEIHEDLDQKPVAGELADPELQDVQAELRARHIVEEHEEEQRIKREHEERVRVAEAARKAPARKATATKATAKAVTKKTPAKKTAAKKAPARKATGS